MSEEQKNRVSSRREFLKGVCKTTGYVIPLVVVLKMGSTKAWAASYGRKANVGSVGSTGRTHDGFFDQLGRFFAHLFHS